MFLWGLNGFESAELLEHYLKQPILFPAHAIQMQRSKKVLKKESADQTNIFLWAKFNVRTANLQYLNWPPEHFVNPPGEISLLNVLSLALLESGILIYPLTPACVSTWLQLLPLVQTLLLAPLKWGPSKFSSPPWPVTPDPVLISSPGSWVRQTWLCPQYPPATWYLSGWPQAVLRTDILFHRPSWSKCRDHSSRYLVFWI